MLTTRLTCKACGLNLCDVPPIWRFVSRDGEALCQHWFGIPASSVPSYVMKTVLDDDDGEPRVVIEWADGGAALRQGNIRRLQANAKVRDG